MLKIDGDLQFLKDDRFSSRNVNMAKIYQRLLSKNIPREKRQDSFDPQRVNLLGEDSICMVNLLVIPQKIFFFFYYMIDLLRLFQLRIFVCQASMKIKMSPLSVQSSINSCEAVNKNVLVAFHSVCHVLDTDKTRSLGNKIL